MICLLFCLIHCLPFEVPLGGRLALLSQEVLLCTVDVDAPRHAHVGRQAGIRRVKDGVSPGVVMEVIALLVARQPRRVDAVGIEDHAILFPCKLYLSKLPFMLARNEDFSDEQG